MKKKLLAMLTAGVIALMSTVPVLGAEAGDVAPASGDMVDVDVIDLSLHAETSGDFGPVYSYANPFQGKDTSQGVVLEFYVKPTWEVHELGAIFAIVGSGDYDGKFYFSPGSYLGFNSAPFGGYFDANLFNYTIVNDYIRDGAKIRIEVTASGFAVYSNDELCYDQNILADSNAGAGDYKADSDFAPVLEWLAGADQLYFGYGSWWNAVGSNEANVDLSEVSFRLMDGTVVMDQLTVDKALVESLGGSVAGAQEQTSVLDIAAADVEIFDINSVEYHGTSAMPVMAGLVIVALVIGILVILASMKKHTYKDI